ncbi:MAG: hypothetical protein MJE66_25240, partial [Proteobacteria bacterium]|nr:hypothetical protein [Pseudomonadota bacterium]
SPHEVTLVEATLERRFTRALPERLIGDRAYDSNALDDKLRADWGMELIAPHQPTRRRKTQDGREEPGTCRKAAAEVRARLRVRRKAFGG